MRVIFLDVDGVMNSRDSHLRAKAAGQSSDLLDICPLHAGLVQRLVTETGARVVVSSTWRIIHKASDLRRMFEARGLHAPIFGVTPTLPRLNRGHEIQKWIDDANGIDLDGMVIIDDDSDMHHLMPWLVKTTFEHGFTDMHLEQAKRILMRPAATRSASQAPGPEGDTKR